MGPEFEWQIGTDKGRRIEVKTPPPRLPSRWQKIFAALAVFLGVCLGVIYVSIPELSKRPEPTPLLAPTTLRPVPATPLPRILTPLEATIDREARALATFDLKTFVAIQDPDDPWWRQQRFQNGYWEKPKFGPLYTIVDSGTLALNRAWADVIQYRNGQYFRETRFYRLRGNQWVRTRPFSDFWSGEPQTVRTEHFDLVFHAPDGPLVKMMADQFEQIYTQTCADLGCPLDRAGSLPRVMTLTLIFRPDAERFDMDWGLKAFILPSPRIQGLYFLDLSGSLPGNNVSLQGVAYNLVPQLIAQMVAGGDERWSRSQKGSLFVRIIGGQETSRIMADADVSDAVVFSYLHDISDIMPLETLWDATWPYTSTLPDAMVGEAWSVIRFIDTQFGSEGTVKFLYAIGPATSLSQAIEASLSVPYADFEQQWRDWLEQRMLLQ